MILPLVNQGELDGEGGGGGGGGGDRLIESEGCCATG